jgi:hypothetical protein
MVAAVIGLAVLVAVIVLVGVFSWKAASHGKREIQARFEQFEASAEARAAAEESKVAAAVQLKEGELADYSGYRAGDPLSRELFLAWRLDQGATTLAKEVFVKNAEGAEVVWELQAGDLQPSGNQIAGDFYLPYSKVDAKGRNRQSGVEQVTCHFAEGTRDSLLGIRRGGAATLRGRLSLVDNRVVLNDARLATEEVEK